MSSIRENRSLPRPMTKAVIAPETASPPFWHRTTRGALIFILVNPTGSPGFDRSVGPGLHSPTIRKCSSLSHGHGFVGNEPKRSLKTWIPKSQPPLMSTSADANGSAISISGDVVFICWPPPNNNRSPRSTGERAICIVLHRSRSVRCSGSRR